MTQKTIITKCSILYMAFELSNKIWKIMFSNGIKRRSRSINAGDLISLAAEIKKSIELLKLPDNVKIYSCYEAGRDGFWLHRFLESQNIKNFVLDAASIEVSRRSKRAKTDRIDVIKLLTMLIRYTNGEEKLWSVARVPSVEEEDLKRINREIARLKKERTGHTNRIKSLLILHGIRISINKDFLANLEEAKQYNREDIPMNLKKEIIREYERYQLIQAQLKKIKEEQQEILESNTQYARKVQALQKLKGIGIVSSWDLVFEYFGWRKFNNVKQVGAASGLAPTPYNSGDSEIEQGISKAGNRRIRTLMIELSWSWLRFQPNSKISLWFKERFGSGKRIRRIGIVAVARKLLISLWQYLEKGIVPEGAIIENVA